MLKISVVTPSYNQGKYLEETIDSVLSQGINNLEYIIMDGGSDDNSVDIIRKYEKYLSYWQSQHDEGQTHALIEGFNRATGDIFCWLNSDDIYMPVVLKKVIHYFSENRELELLYGDYIRLYPDGQRIAKPKISFDFSIALHAYLMIPQSSSFWTKRLYNAIGGLNPSFQYAFDCDFFLRAGFHLKNRPLAIKHVQDIWSQFRLHPTSKTVAEKKKWPKEFKEIYAHFGMPNSILMRKPRYYYELVRAMYRFHRERGFIPTGEMK
ncbi:glycosyltransferase family 2 protein [Candidatus Latescibacterota bacterium]